MLPQPPMASSLPRPSRARAVDAPSAPAAGLAVSPRGPGHPRGQPDARGGDAAHSRGPGRGPTDTRAGHAWAGETCAPGAWSSCGRMRQFVSTLQGRERASERAARPAHAQRGQRYRDSVSPLPGRTQGWGRGAAPVQKVEGGRDRPTPAHNRLPERH